MSYDLGIKVKNKKLSESFVDFLNQQGEKSSFFSNLNWNNDPTYLDKRCNFFAVSYSSLSFYSSIYVYSIFYNLAIKYGIYKTINNIKVVELYYENGIVFQLATQNPFNQEDKLFLSFIPINDQGLFDYKKAYEYNSLMKSFDYIQEQFKEEYKNKIIEELDKIVKETESIIYMIHTHNFEV